MSHAASGKNRVMGTAENRGLVRGGGHDFRAILGSLWYDGRMNLTLHLSPELEAKLREQAKAEGKAPEQVAMKALEMQLESGPLAAATMSAEQWVADIRSWATSHRSLPREVDDSRESIYAGRGE